MQTMKVRVVMADGTDGTYPVTPRVVVGFERKFDMGLGRAFGENGENRAEHMYWIAWEASRTDGKTALSFDDWLDRVEDVEVDTDDIAPFDEAPPDG